MAVKTYMRPTLAIIAREVAAYAKNQRLERRDFALVGAWQERTGRISLELRTTRNAGWFSWYRDIMTQIQKSFEEVGAPDASWNVGLVIQGERETGHLISGFRLAEGEEDVTDYLESMIDKEWAELEPSHTATVAPA